MDFICCAIMRLGRLQTLTTSNTWGSVTDGNANKLRSHYDYSANGNITAAQRFDENGI